MTDISTTIRFEGNTGPLEAAAKRAAKAIQTVERINKRNGKVASHTVTTTTKAWQGNTKVIERNTKVLKKSSGMMKVLTAQTKQLITAFLGFEAVRRLIASIVNGIKRLVEVQALVERTEILFQSFGMSVEKAKASMGEFVDFALISVLQLEEILKVIPQIQIQEIIDITSPEGIKKTEEFLETVGALAKAAGKDIEDMVRAVGYAQRGMFRTQMLIPAFLNPSQLKKDIQTGMSAADAALKQWKVKISNLGTAMEKSLTVKISNISDMFFKIWKSLGKVAEKPIKKFIDWLLKQFQIFIDYLERNKKAIGNFFSSAVDSTINFVENLKIVLDILGEILIVAQKISPLLVGIGTFWGLSKVAAKIGIGTAAGTGSAIGGGVAAAAYSPGFRKAFPRFANLFNKETEIAGNLTGLQKLWKVLTTPHDLKSVPSYVNKFWNSIKNWRGVIPSGIAGLKNLGTAILSLVTSVTGSIAIVIAAGYKVYSTIKGLSREINNLTSDTEAALDQANENIRKLREIEKTKREKKETLSPEEKKLLDKLTDIYYKEDIEKYLEERNKITKNQLEVGTIKVPQGKLPYGIQPEHPKIITEEDIPEGEKRTIRENAGLKALEEISSSSEAISGKFQSSVEILNTATSYLGKDIVRFENGIKKTSNTCSTFVSTVLKETGILEKTINWVPSLRQELLTKGAIRVSDIEVQEGDIAFQIGENGRYPHVVIFKKKTGKGFIGIGEPGSKGPVKEQFFPDIKGFEFLRPIKEVTAEGFSLLKRWNDLERIRNEKSREAYRTQELNILLGLDAAEAERILNESRFNTQKDFIEGLLELRDTFGFTDEDLKRFNEEIEKFIALKPEKTVNEILETLSTLSDIEIASFSPETIKGIMEELSSNLPPMKSEKDMMFERGFEKGGFTGAALAMAEEIASPFKGEEGEKAKAWKKTAEIAEKSQEMKASIFGQEPLEKAQSMKSFYESQIGSIVDNLINAQESGDENLIKFWEGVLEEYLGKLKETNELIENIQKQLAKPGGDKGPWNWADATKGALQYNKETDQWERPRSWRSFGEAAILGTIEAMGQGQNIRESIFSGLQGAAGLIKGPWGTIVSSVLSLAKGWFTRKPLEPDVIYNVRVINPEDLFTEFLRVTEAFRGFRTGQGIDAFHDSINVGEVAMGYG